MGNKFKVGDRVRYVGGDTIAAKPGATAVVTGHADHYIGLVWDMNPLTNGQKDGKYEPYKFELIPPTAQAVSGAIRTVTRREIVPGVYGRVSVQGMLRSSVGLTIEDADAFSASELRKAAHLFNQFAEVLEENAAAQDDLKEAA